MKVKTKTLGILGTGQLGRMSALAAAELGIRVHVYGPDKDSPAEQRRFANSRGWRFALASHAGTSYLTEQDIGDGGNMPGAVVYERDGDSITRKNTAVFGPGDLYCSIWNLLGLAGLTENEWTPQYNYWLRPEKLIDGGENVLG